MRGLAFYFVAPCAVWAGFIAHEAAHWAMGRALGHDMVMSLNSASAAAGQEVAVAHALLITAAGPAFTVALGLVSYVFCLRGAALAYPLLFSTFFMRFIASGVSLFNPNDEMRLGSALGLGSWTLPLAVTSTLLALTVHASVRLRLGWIANLATFLLCALATTALVYADQLPR